MSPTRRRRTSTPSLVPPSPLSLATIRNLRFSNAFPVDPPSPLPKQLHHIATTLLAVQAQETDAALLSFWLRLPHPRPPRSALPPLLLQGSHVARLSRVWANRGTIQVVTTADRPFLRAAVVDQLVKNRRSAMTRQQLSRSIHIYDRADAQISKWLADGKPVTSAEVDSLVKSLIENEKATANSAGKKRFTKSAIAEASRCICYSLLVLATADGRAERIVAPGDGGRRTVVSTPQHQRSSIHITNATTECAKRYFAAYGPATEPDFRYWMGIPAGQSKEAVQELMDGGEIETVRTELGDMLVMRAARLEAISDTVRLVGKFEPILLAHKNKNWIVREEWRRRVWSKNADVAACVLIGGRVRGIWKKAGSGIEVSLFEGHGEDAIKDAEMRAVFEGARDILEGFYGLDGAIHMEKERDGEVALLDEAEFSAAPRNFEASKGRASKRRKRG